MKVKRTVTMKVDNFEIGDQITVKLREYGKFTATAHELHRVGVSVPLLQKSGVSSAIR